MSDRNNSWIFCVYECFDPIWPADKKVRFLFKLRVTSSQPKCLLSNRLSTNEHIGLHDVTSYCSLLTVNNTICNFNGCLVFNNDFKRCSFLKSLVFK